MDFSDLSDSEEEKENRAMEEARVKERDSLQAYLQSNPTHYTTMFRLVEVLRRGCEFEELRKIRKRFASCHPLSEALWLQWIEDEERMDELKCEEVIDLTAQSFEDYLSCTLRLKNIMHFQKQVPPPSVKEVKALFEESIKLVGHDVKEGLKMWASYADYESEVDMKRTGKNCRKKLTAWKVYHRWIESPIRGGDLALQCYKDYESSLVESKKVSVEDSNTHIKRAEELLLKAKKTLKFLLPMEEAVSKAEEAKDLNAHISAWLSYIATEEASSKESGNNSERLLCVFERAVAACPLSEEIWLQYGRVALKVSKASKTKKHFRDNESCIPFFDKNFALQVLYRATRNCWGSGSLWIERMRAHEAFGIDAESMKCLFRICISQTLQSHGQYVSAWITYLGYYRRRLLAFKCGKGSKNKKNYEGSREEMREAFQDGLEWIETKYPGWKEGRYTIEQAFAEAEEEASIIEADAFAIALCEDAFQPSIRIWENIVTQRSCEWSVWMSYFQTARRWALLAPLLSKRYDRCRSILKRAVDCVTDYPIAAAETYFHFEQCVGSLSNLNDAMQCKISAYKSSSVDTADATWWKKPQQKSRYRSRKGKGKEMGKSKNKKSFEAKRKEEGKASKAKSKKVPGNKEEEKHSKKRKRESTDIDKEENVNKRKKNAPKELKKNGERVPASTAAKVNESKTETETKSETSERNGRTVFIKNIDIDVTSNELRAALLALPLYSGENEKKIKEPLIRIITNKHTGRSKGYAYVDFDDAATAALVLEQTAKSTGTPISLRGRKIKLTLSTRAMKNGSNDNSNETFHPDTIFVSGLCENVTKDDLWKVFQSAGPITDVRLLVDQLGKSKGFALIQYISSRSIEKALELNGTSLKGYAVTVCRSRFPAVKEKKTRKQGKGMMPMMPRSMRRRTRFQPHTKLEENSVEKSSDESAKRSVGLKQNDFRSLLIAGHKGK
eukprot:g6483.t1